MSSHRPVGGSVRWQRSSASSAQAARESRTQPDHTPALRPSQQMRLSYNSRQHNPSTRRGIWGESLTRYLKTFLLAVISRAPGHTNPRTLWAWWGPCPCVSPAPVFVLLENTADRRRRSLCGQQQGLHSGKRPTTQGSGASQSPGCVLDHGGATGLMSPRDIAPAKARSHTQTGGGHDKSVTHAYKHERAASLLGSLPSSESGMMSIPQASGLSCRESWEVSHLPTCKRKEKTDNGESIK